MRPLLRHKQVLTNLRSKYEEKKTDNKNDKKETILKKLANVYAANIMLLHTLSYLAPLLASIHEEK